MNTSSSSTFSSLFLLVIVLVAGGFIGSELIQSMNEISTLKAEVDTLNAATRQVLAERDQAVAQVQARDQELASLRDALAAEQQLREQAVGEVETARQEAAALQNGLSIEQQLRLQAAEEAETARQESAGLRQQLETVTAARDQLQDRVSQLEQQVAQNTPVDPQMDQPAAQPPALLEQAPILVTGPASWLTEFYQSDLLVWALIAASGLFVASATFGMWGRRKDPREKVTFTMTRAERDAFIRYQRGRSQGNPPQH